MEKQRIDELLFQNISAHKAEHSDKFIDHFLEQYKTYVDLLDKTGTRRQKSNEFFLALNTGIIGILGYIETKNVDYAPIIFILVPLVGMTICFFWMRLIISYKMLTRAKFTIIHRLEKHLPMALYETEWEVLGRGKERGNYRPFTNIERNIPIIFIVLYTVIILVNMLG